MSQRICEIGHPQGRYSSDFSVCFPMRTNTTVSVSTSVWKSVTFPFHSLRAVWVNTGSKRCHFESDFLPNKQSTKRRSYKLPSAWRKLNTKTKQNTTTAEAIDTCSHFWWFIIPSWTQLKQNLSQPPTLTWWMISRENSQNFFPLFQTLHRHLERTLQNTLSTLPFPAHRPRGERQIRSHVALRVPTTGHKNDRLQDLFKLSFWQRRGVVRVLDFCPSHVTRGMVWNSFTTTHPIVSLTMHKFWDVGGNGGATSLEEDDTPPKGFSLGEYF